MSPAQATLAPRYARIAQGPASSGRLSPDALPRRADPDARADSSTVDGGIAGLRELVECGPARATDRRDHAQACEAAEREGVRETLLDRSYRSRLPASGSARSAAEEVASLRRPRYALPSRLSAFLRRSRRRGRALRATSGRRPPSRCRRPRATACRRPRPSARSRRGARSARRATRARRS